MTLIYFIHGVATRDATYAKPLIKLIQEECKRQNQPIPHCHAGFWGNVLTGTEKLWRDVDQELQVQKQKDSKFNPDRAFRHQNFRKEYLSYFIGDAFSYLSSDRGEKIRRIILDQLTDLVKAHPTEKELHIVAHSLGTVILWDVLFSDRFSSGDPAREIRALIGKEDGKIALSSVTTMGAPIPFLNLTLCIDGLQIQNFLDRYQANRLIWNNLVNSYDIIAYPIRPLFDSIASSLKITVFDYYMEANADLFDSVEIASVVFTSLSAHSYYLSSNKVAQIIASNIVGKNQSLARLAIDRLKNAEGMTEDNSANSPIPGKVLVSAKFRDSSGKISLISDVLGVDHIYVFDHKFDFLYAGYVGWIHGESLKKIVKKITEDLCDNVSQENYFQISKTMSKNKK